MKANLGIWGFRKENIKTNRQIDNILLKYVRFFEESRTSYFFSEIY